MRFAAPAIEIPRSIQKPDRLGGGEPNLPPMSMSEERKISTSDRQSLDDRGSMGEQETGVRRERPVQHLRAIEAAIGVVETYQFDRAGRSLLPFDGDGDRLVAQDAHVACFQETSDGFGIGRSASVVMVAEHPIHVLVACQFIEQSRVDHVALVEVITAEQDEIGTPAVQEVQCGPRKIRARSRPSRVKVGEKGQPEAGNALPGPG